MTFVVDASSQFHLIIEQEVVPTYSILRNLIMRGHSMSFDLEVICKNIEQLTNTQLKIYTKTLRSSLLEAGVEKDVVDSALKSSVQKLKRMSSFNTDCQRVICSAYDQAHLKGKRGIDSIGRILVEYCFIRIPEHKMIWPESSEQDKKSRESYTHGIIPRPFMNYFLVSVRGTIPELNKFDASSVLFGEENEAHEERKKYVDSLVKEFEANESIPLRSKWDHIYTDARFQTAARDLIRDIRKKMEQFGLERYLRVLENLRQRDPDNKGSNRMHRPFNFEDAKQLENALWSAEEALAKPRD